MRDFYIGYQPIAPAGLARRLRRVVTGLGILAAALAAILVVAQAPFPASSFAYQQYREYEGTLEESPYPALLTGSRSYLLVGPGKHGIAALVRGLDQRPVRLRGALIERDAGAMLELLPGSLEAAGRADHAAAAQELGEAVFRGEIVDSKCYLGVMNPGQGKVHRDCAARCISGGIPPALLVRDAGGHTRTVLLAGADGRPLHRELLEWVAEPVEIRGRLVRVAAGLVLQAEPRNIRGLARE